MRIIYFDTISEIMINKTITREKKHVQGDLIEIGIMGPLKILKINQMVVLNVSFIQTVQRGTLCKTYSVSNSEMLSLHENYR